METWYASVKLTNWISQNVNQAVLQLSSCLHVLNWDTPSSGLYAHIHMSSTSSQRIAVEWYMYWTFITTLWLFFTYAISWPSGFWFAMWAALRVTLWLGKRTEGSNVERSIVSNEYTYLLQHTLSTICLSLVNSGWSIGTCHSTINLASLDTFQVL